jgi:predicted AlkP superfamily phosphohydrolase/phosphomutase
MSRGLTVIGLDAATFDVIDPLVAAGELPNLARILTSGARGSLRSTTHPLTPLAWTTMVTGVNAGRHGIWDFVERDEMGHHVRLVNGSFRRAPAVWDILSEAGRSAGIVNIPFTWPAPEVNGFSISGLDASAREDGMTYPADLFDTLQDRFGPLVLDHAFPIDDKGAIDLDRVRRACEQRVESVLWLSQQFRPDLLFVVFMSADHIHHLCWPEWERDGAKSRVAEVYRLLDEAVGAIVGSTDPERDLMIVSDHGGGSLEGVVNLNAWLAAEGYLSYVDQESDLRSAELGRRLMHRLFDLQRRLPQGTRSALKRHLPGVRDQALKLREYTVVDWSRTQAFSYGTFGNIVLNVRDRERHGIVDPEDYERLRDEIAAKVRELRSPAGEPIVAAVHRREDLFHGAALDRVPDLVVEFDRYAWLGKGTLTSRSDSIWDTIEIAPGSDLSYVGSHRHEGVIALVGPSARSGIEVDASIEDVMPTILYLLGEPIPADLDGRLLAEAIDSSLLDERPPEYTQPSALQPVGVTPYSGGGAEVESRLRGLGYIE